MCAPEYGEEAAGRARTHRLDVALRPSPGAVAPARGVRGVALATLEAHETRYEVGEIGGERRGRTQIAITNRGEDAYYRFAEWASGPHAHARPLARAEGWARRGITRLSAREVVDVEGRGGASAALLIAGRAQDLVVEVHRARADGRTSQTIGPVR